MLNTREKSGNGILLPLEVPGINPHSFYQVIKKTLDLFVLPDNSESRWGDTSHLMARSLGVCLNSSESRNGNQSIVVFKLDHGLPPCWVSTAVAMCIMSGWDDDIFKVTVSFPTILYLSHTYGCGNNYSKQIFNLQSIFNTIFCHVVLTQLVQFLGLQDPPPSLGCCCHSLLPSPPCSYSKTVKERESRTWRMGTTLIIADHIPLSASIDGFDVDGKLEVEGLEWMLASPLLLYWWIWG